jgi:AraC-like DNA-binding protein
MLTNSLPLTGVSAFETIPFIRGSNGGTSTQLRWRERADRQCSNLGPAPRGYADGSLEVREELLSRLLADEEESLNRLYNIVSQVGLHILFFDEKERLAGGYRDATKGDRQAAYVKQTFNRDSAEKVKSWLAAPIFDAEGGLLGFLDVSPANGDLTGEASTLASTVMRTTARAIEERSFRKQYRREWIVALAPPEGGGRGMLLAVDGQQRIVGADRHARSTLSASKINLGGGPTLWALFEKDAALFRNRNIGDVHAALVTADSAQVWATIVTPPESDALRQHSPEYATLHSRPRLDSIGRFRRSEPPAPSAGGLTPRALQRIREYIEEHLTENIELETLAVIAGLSKWHFARAFKQSVGTPPHCYLIQRRLQRAQELLAETDLSLAQIALQSGFSDQSHFSRRFRLFFGATPRSFRWSKR